MRGLRGTGPGGRILKQDVEDMAQSVAYGAAVPRPAAPAGAPSRVSLPGRPMPPRRPPGGTAGPCPGARGPRGRAGTGRCPSGTRTTLDEEVAVCPLLGGVIENDGHGPVERVPFRGVRRSMARHMAEAVAKQAQVTTMDEADVTIIKRIREKESTLAAERGVRLTYLAFVVKACTASLKRFPV